MYMRKLTSQVVCNYDDPVAETKKGKLRGVKIDSTYIFRGVKYADAKRFHLPTAVEPWDGVKEALNYGYCCPELNTPVPPDAYLDPHFYYPQDENCQYLNVWTQTLDENAKKPVMVWMHGGGWFMGSSVEIYSYDGENLSAFGDVVVVSLNHRTNILGFMDLSAYGDEYKYSANCGLADLVAALKWVKENIAAFGGDPDNVTIMGQSGGGAKVLSMLSTPSAYGLVQKVIMQSGGPTGRKDDSAKENALRFTEEVMKNLGLTKETYKEIETVHYYDLAEAAKKAIADLGSEGITINWGPQYDGDFYLGHPLVYGFQEETKNVPILGGSVMGEFTSNALRSPLQSSKNSWDDETKMKLLKEKFGDDAEAIVEEFKKAYPEKNYVDVMFMDVNLRKGFMEFCKAKAAYGGAPIYNWLFNFESPYKGGGVAWHNSEEPFMFHNADCIETAYVPGVSEKLQDQMAGAWVAFAKTGNPNHDLIPEWKPVTPDTVNTLIFDRECRLGVDHDKKLTGLIPDLGLFGGRK